MKTKLFFFISIVFFIFSCSTAEDRAYVNLTFDNNSGAITDNAFSKKRAVPSVVNTIEITVFINNSIPVLNNTYTTETTSATLELDPGSNYVFLIEAMDASDTLQYQGKSDPVELLAGEEKNITISMEEIIEPEPSRVSLSLKDGDASDNLFDISNANNGQMHIAVFTLDSPVFDQDKEAMKEFQFKCSDLFNAEIAGSPYGSPEFDIAVQATVEDFVYIVAWDSTSATTPMQYIGANRWTDATSSSADILVFSCQNEDASPGILHDFCNCTE